MAVYTLEMLARAPPSGALVPLWHIQDVCLELPHIFSVLLSPLLGGLDEKPFPG